MDAITEKQSYPEHDKTADDRDAERHLSSALRLTEALNVLLIQSRGAKPQKGHAEIWPVQTILGEIEAHLFGAAHHFLAPSAEEMKQEIANHAAERKVAWLKFKAEEEGSAQ